MKSIWLSGIVTVLLALTWLPNSTGQTATLRKMNSVSSTEMPSALGGGTMAVWSGGALLVVQDRFSPAPVFKSFDANKKQLSQFVLAISDAALIKVFAFARGIDGSISAAGTAVTNDSRGTPFLALISADGQKQTILRIYPVFAQALTVAPDGTTWVASEEEVQPGSHANHEQALLRRYDRDGRLLGSFIPWSSLPAEPHTGPPSMRSRLVAGTDRVGWYAPLAHTYMELKLDGTVISRVDTHLIEGYRGVASLALCADGGAFIGGSFTGESQPPPWGIFAFDREHGAWNSFPRDSKGGVILGCEGTRLATTVDGRTISWLEPIK